MIDRAKFEELHETWVKAQEYRRDFLENIYKEQIYLASNGISWTDSDKMPYVERRFSVRQIADSRVEAREKAQRGVSG